MKKIIFAISLSALLLCSCTSGNRNAGETVDRFQWWQEARYGMFLHWGISTLEGFEISWPRDGFGPERYDSLALRFNPVDFNPDAWIDIAERGGMKYMVLTAKHHDGFCLWDTQTTDHNIMNTPYGQDICAKLADAAHRRGMRLGWYFSVRQWNDPDCSSPENNDAYVARMKTQLKELLSNYGKIDLLWFDYEGWPCPADPREIFNYVLELQPDIIINNRLYPLTPDESHAYVGECGMYATPEQFVGGYGSVPWETCSTSSSSRQWSIRYNDPPRPADDLIWEVIGAAGGNGNMLMNVGPDSLGVIPAAYADRLAEVGDWIGSHPGILYGTVCGPWKPTGKYVSTRKGSHVSLVIREGHDIVLPCTDSLKILSAVTEGGLLVGYDMRGDSVEFVLPEVLSGLADVVVDIEAEGLPDEPLDPFSTSGSLAYCRPAEASSSLSDVYMHCPASAFDDNEATLWVPGRIKDLDEIDIYGKDIHYKDDAMKDYYHTDATLSVDLGDAFAVSRFDVLLSRKAGRVAIEYLDGETWKEVARANGADGKWKGRIRPVSARFWRLKLENTDLHCGVREFRLFSD